MPDLVPIRLDEAIAEVERELMVRARVYEAWMKSGRLSREAAERQMNRLDAARLFLIEFRRERGGHYVRNGIGRAVEG